MTFPLRQMDIRAQGSAGPKPFRGFGKEKSRMQLSKVISNDLQKQNTVSCPCFTVHTAQHIRTGHFRLFGVREPAASQPDTIMSFSSLCPASVRAKGGLPSKVRSCAPKQHYRALELS